MSQVKIDISFHLMLFLDRIFVGILLTVGIICIDQYISPVVRQHSDTDLCTLPDDILVGSITGSGVVNSGHQN